MEIYSLDNSEDEITINDFSIVLVIDNNQRKLNFGCTCNHCSNANAEVKSLSNGEICISCPECKVVVKEPLSEWSKHFHEYTPQKIHELQQVFI